ncbi:peptide chain release factor H [Sporocytophaga myxococcoides]|uniref:Peptide chain release factor H n=1 Tax=Sporocytophaga myxococcoides TaxID=153721 RepID=A0A098LF54_9BACT|nr:peptide chain release factor H [Sporocytophaga myxococcoides]GAL85606.1 peptide chain release factor H [Sporocytophaga myxococcoides]
MNEYLVQISSGRGPEECWKVVAKVLEIFLKEAKKENLSANIVDKEVGPLNGTLLSVSVLIKGIRGKEFLINWEGSILWISPSPYRKFHKRKNWFVGIKAYDVADIFVWNDREVVFESLRASGPGGQHVNKTESAIRAKHLPSGISVVASERRSQYQNKSEALEGLKVKVLGWNADEASKKVQSQWNQHNCLERGNPVRTFNERL